MYPMELEADEEKKLAKEQWLSEDEGSTMEHRKNSEEYYHKYQKYGGQGLLRKDLSCGDRQGPFDMIISNRNKQMHDEVEKIMHTEKDQIIERPHINVNRSFNENQQIDDAYRQI